MEIKFTFIIINVIIIIIIIIIIIVVINVIIIVIITIVIIIGNFVGFDIKNCCCFVRETNFLVKYFISF